VTRLALTGSTPPEIAAITGHSLGDVGTILDAHYLSRDPQLAWNAIRKLESGWPKGTVSGTDSPNYVPNWPVLSDGETEKAS
jgi:hypothetical protein